MLAFGVVFVLLLGEIDLSIAYLSGVAGVVAAELQQPDSGHHLPGHLADRRRARSSATLIGAFQGSFVALIGVPSFVVTLAGLLAWQGVDPGRDRRRRPDHHPEPLDQLHRVVLLLERRRAG